MGDMFSTKKNTNTNATTNQQVALQNDRGGAGVGISGSNLTNSNVTVTSSDPEVVIEALKQMGNQGDNNAVVAINATNSANITAQRALETLQNVAMTAGEYMDRATERSQNIALQATPISGGEIVAINKQSSNELLLKGGIAIAFVYLGSKLLRNN